jgi:hypothetical protein
MHHQWRLRRATVSVADGDRRWDRAYQLVLEWADRAAAQPLPQTLAPTNRTIRSGTHQRWEEAPHADRHLRSRLNPQPSAESDH